MLFGKKIKLLEDKVDALEVRVKEFLEITSKYCQDVDALLLLYKNQEAAKESAKPAPRPRRRQRRNNGKETPKATE